MKAKSVKTQDPGTQIDPANRKNRIESFTVSELMR
jgi:hypothetical protein